jgi:hypothetical protein
MISCTTPFPQRFSSSATLKVVWSDAVQRRQNARAARGTARGSPRFVRPPPHPEVAHDADGRRVAPRVAAKRAGVRFVKSQQMPAEPNALFDVGDGARQSCGVFGGRA